MLEINFSVSKLNKPRKIVHLGAHWKLKSEKKLNFELWVIPPKEIPIWEKKKWEHLNRPFLESSSLLKCVSTGKGIANSPIPISYTSRYHRDRLFSCSSRKDIQQLKTIHVINPRGTPSANRNAKTLLYILIPATTNSPQNSFRTPIPIRNPNFFQIPNSQIPSP